MAVKDKDFIEISFVGRFKSNNEIFDLTDIDLAKKKGIFNPNINYKPKKMCVGQKHVIKGLDMQLIGKETGKSYIIEVSHEEGFGNKDPKLIKIVNINQFKKDNINPFPGLQINADGMLGTIRSVTGGRVVVDFNHPLSGRDLVYEVTILREIKDDNEKLSILLLNELGLREKDYEITKNELKYDIKLKRILPKEIEDLFTKRVNELIPTLHINFQLDEKKDIRE